MRKRLSLVCFAAAFAALFGTDTPQASAQVGPFGRVGSQAYQPDTFRRVAADVKVGLPGRLWVESNFADQGLGYTGSYLTVGGKTRLFEDFLDGRWLTEARLHHSIEDDGGFFANVGIERVFSIDAAKADIVVGAWYDFDGDQQGNFGHDFSQVGVNAAIKSRRWDLVGNGYFPVGIQNYTSGDITGVDFFLGNNILLQPGIDSALTGFDVTLRLKPKQLAFMNGSFELGGYGYRSDLINSFGGGRVRLGLQTKRGLVLGAEIAHDDRFETTGGFSVGYNFGAIGGTNSEYSALGRDLEQTIRNDHIVRFNQSVELAIDPDTGAPYNVIHVNNTSDASVADGTAENPFEALQRAQFASAVGDVIYVDAGDGTTNNYDQGIILKDDQLLLSNGSEHILDIQDGRRFRLNAGGGVAATISNPGQFDVIRMANNNLVGGITVDATDATNGITGLNANGGEIRSTTVSGANEYGIILSDISGDWEFSRNTFNSNLIDGLFINGSSDPTAVYEFVSNDFSNNGFDGVHLERFRGSQITFNSNTTSNNGRHGLFLEDYLTPGGNVDIVSAVSMDNAEFGILIERGDGNLNVVNSTVTGNLGGGVKTDTWSNMTAGQRTFIGSIDGGVTTISGNGVGAGANLQFDLFEDGIVQDVLVTGLSLDNGGRGIQGTASGDGATLNLDVIDMISISNNTGDGIRLLAEAGGTLNAQILNTGVAPLAIIDNAEANGAGIFIAANGSAGVAPSVVNAVIDNVNIAIPGSTLASNGLEISSLGNAFVDISLTNSDINKSLTPTFPTGELLDNDIGISMNFNNDIGANFNEVFIQNVNITADNGIFLNTEANTLTDFTILESTIQAAGPRVVQRVSSAPFIADLPNENGFTEFGNRGIVIRANGDASDALADNLTRISIRDVLIQDFAGTVFGSGGDEEVGFGALPGLIGQGNRALNGSAVDIATTGDANLLLTFSENRLLNNGAGYNNDADNDNVFNDQPVTVDEDSTNLFFFDALKINAFDSSIVSARIGNNFFQDNFERAIGLNTYQSATINAVLVNNAFENNDRGRDADIIILPSLLLDNPILYSLAHDTADIELINNEEFYFRPYEHTLITDIAGVPIDAAGDAIAQDDLLALGQDARAGLPTGFANMCIGLSNNVFQTGGDIQDFSAAPGDLQLGLDGLTNGSTLGTGNSTATTFGICEQLISNEELFFLGRGFEAAIH